MSMPRIIETCEQWEWSSFPIVQQTKAPIVNKGASNVHQNSDTTHHLALLVKYLHWPTTQRTGCLLHALVRHYNCSKPVCAGGAVLSNTVLQCFVLSLASTPSDHSQLYSTRHELF